MLNIFKLLFQKKNTKTSEDKFLENEDTKKCKRCLRRVKISFPRCPYCSSDDFQF